jgi:hypothetical protein
VPTHMTPALSENNRTTRTRSSFTTTKAPIGPSAV